MNYRIDPSRFSYRDLRSEASPLAAAFFWLLLKLRLPLPASSDHPAVDELDPHRIRNEQVPAEVLDELSEAKAALESLGFKGTIYHHFFDKAQRTEIYQSTYLHPSGKAIARFSRRVFSATNPPQTHNHCTFVTPLTRGRSLGTANLKGDMQGPDSCVDECVGELSIEATWSRHVERLREPEVRESIDPIANGREALAVLQARHRAITDQLVERGIYKPIDEPALAESTNVYEPGAAEGVDPMLLAEVRRMEDKRPTSWTTSLVILVGTIALFLGFGGVVWSWRFTALLIPILLFHEAGHYLAMKLFDYRNVQMFFIPMFGAAVSGRHYDVPGWKRVVTSLMGPVPGIVLGVGMGVVALVQQQDLLMEAAVLTLILNGFNLIPSLPLDGGWVMHGLLFSRHAFLDLLARLFGIAVLFFLAFVGGTRITMYLAIAMIFGLPMAFNLARITDRLRGAAEPLGPPEGGHAPASAVGRIAEQIDDAYPKGLDVRNKAKLALQVYENVNSRPPGLLATLTLGAVYLGSLATASVAGLVFLVAQQGDLTQLLADAAFGPQIEVSSSELRSHPDDLSAEEAAWGETLVVNYETPEVARAEYDALLNDGVLPGEALLYGATALIELPVGVTDDQRDALFDRCEAATQNLFLDSEQSSVLLQVFMLTPTAEDSERIANEVLGYCSAPSSLRLRPPWEEGLTDEQQLARRTAALLLRTEWMAEAEFPEEYYEEIEAAKRRGREEAVVALHEELIAKNRDVRDAYLRTLRERDPSEIDPEVIDAYQRGLEQLSADEADADSERPEGFYFQVHPDEPPAEQWMEPIAERLGCLPSDAPPRPDAPGEHGFGEANGLSLNLTLTFKSAPGGPVRVLRWLEEQRGIDIKYSLSQDWFQKLAEEGEDL